MAVWVGYPSLPGLYRVPLIGSFPELYRVPLTGSCVCLNLLEFELNENCIEHDSIQVRRYSVHCVCFISIPLRSEHSYTAVGVRRPKPQTLTPKPYYYLNLHRAESHTDHAHVPPLLSIDGRSSCTWGCTVRRTCLPGRFSTNRSSIYGGGP